jgi:hypothetical protein
MSFPGAYYYRDCCTACYYFYYRLVSDLLYEFN